VLLFWAANLSRTPNAVNAIVNSRDANGTAGIQPAQQGATFAYSENSRNGKQIAALESSLFPFLSLPFCLIEGANHFLVKPIL